MSYLSTTENVSFNGLSQNISDASCATQFKMAVEGVSGISGSEVNMYLQESSGDEQTYMPHLNDNNYFHTKFKIDPNELYTFHDSDVIAGEITVSHTEDNFEFPDTDDTKCKLLDSPNKELDLIGSLTNGDIKKEIEEEVVSNGHLTHYNKPPLLIDTKAINNLQKVSRSKSQSSEMTRSNSFPQARRSSVHSPKNINNVPASSNSQASITSVNNAKNIVTNKSATETFLDVFKREQGVHESNMVVIKTEPQVSTPPPPKVPIVTPKKHPSAKPPSQSKPKRGRGPAVHEALQRIPTQPRATPILNTTWHAPGDDLFECGPLDSRKPYPMRLNESSSSDDDNMPGFDSGNGVSCVEECAAESRGARLALRRAALRRHVAMADSALKLKSSYRQQRVLASIIKKQMSKQNSLGRLPTQTLNHLLAVSGMPSLLTSQERRKLRQTGWSGGENGSSAPGMTCAEENCTLPPMPCGQYCFSHVTLSTEQRLYASCAAVFAGGSRCQQPLLPLQDQTPLCAEHAWKRDNYDKLVREVKPKRPQPRPRTWRRPRRRPPLHTASKPHPNTQTLASDLNVCSNSSNYDSSEDTAMALSESELLAANNTHELEICEVGQVPPDDILDPAVLSQIQIPDEAFTEFLNQAEGGTAFAESSELAAALEAVLDDCVLQPAKPRPPSDLTQVKVSSASMEMSSSATS